MFRVSFTGHRLVIAGTGIRAVLLGIAVVFVLLSVPRWFTDSLTADQAKNSVRHFLEWQIYERGTEQLKNNGAKIPDAAMAQRWKEQVDRVKQLEMISVQIRRPIFHLFSIRSSYVVKVIFRDGHRSYPPRYFSTFHQMVTAESSELAWWFAF